LLSERASLFNLDAADWKVSGNQFRIDHSYNYETPYNVAFG
jgi:hypothetical protein